MLPRQKAERQRIGKRKEAKHRFYSDHYVQCGNHGSCKYCAANRLYFDRRYRLAADDDVAYYRRYGKVEDGS